MSCVALFCSTRRNADTKARGITFHKCPKDQHMRKKWEDSTRTKEFTASNNFVLCSEHFKKEDFDRTGLTVRLKDGVVPSIFNLPAHLQEPVKRSTTVTPRRTKDSHPTVSQDDQETFTPQPQLSNTRKVEYHNIEIMVEDYNQVEIEEAANHQMKVENPDMKIEKSDEN
ncbi:THAP domain-containing protein 6 [Fundulus heteroclitus]|uniref:THAP domain-containing protein 6 n=1 Tax=Fundulus heteroclitus TaxID=8078 RepID=UPI00165A5255|nr:THAP domain-containing protein 6 [Fundulus heteroclitus]